MHQIDSYSNQKGYEVLNNITNELTLIYVYQTAMTLFNNRTDLFGTAVCPGKTRHSQTSLHLDIVT